MSTQASNQALKASPEGASLYDSIKALEPQIRAAADTIEEQRCLPDNLVDALRETGLFRASWPRSMGGLEMNPVSQLKALEELSRYDGSVGWVGTFGAICGMFGSFLDPEGARELFPGPDTPFVSAGQYSPNGRAERVDGGYRMSGKWQFGSGCRHADVMMGGCFVINDGEIEKADNGRPKVLMLFLPKSSTNIILDSWQVAGLCGTGSHDYTVEDVFVPENRTFTFDYVDKPFHDGALYKFPGLFLFSHLAMPLGIARAALDYIYELGETKRLISGTGLLKEQGEAHEAVARAEASLRSVRAWTYEVMQDVWDTLQSGDRLSHDQRSGFRLTQVHVSHAAKDIVAQMYDLAGSSAIRLGSPIDRLMRDIRAVCAHIVVQQKMYRPAGKMLFGIEVKNDPFF